MSEMKKTIESQINAIETIIASTRLCGLENEIDILLDLSENLKEVLEEEVESRGYYSSTKGS